MLLLEGKSVATALRAHIKDEIASLAKSARRIPGLAVILVGEDAGSQVYVRNKEKSCAEVGIHSVAYRLPADTKQADLENLIDELNENDEIDGILLQLPLPKGLNSQPCLERISPKKDVDGLHPENQGRVSLGLPGIRPCTPAGVMVLLKYYNLSVEGKNVVVLGRSNLVGRPLALMLSAKPANATVTICHSRTKNINDICRNADFVFAAIGDPKYIKPDMVKKNAVIIDIGMNRLEEGLCGDADFVALSSCVSAMTPVPGGIGLMTIAQLLANTVQIWKINMGIASAEEAWNTDFFKDTV